MFQESEIINLILSIGALCIFIPFLRTRGFAGLHLFLAGFALIIAAQIFTVVEGVVWESFFNHLEHLCYGVSGIFFALAVARLRRTWESGQEA